MKQVLLIMALALLSLHKVEASEYITTRSLRAVDGDTLYNKTTGEYYRLADIDTPEKGQCGYTEAKNFLSIYLVSHETIKIDKLYKDVYDRQVIEADNLSLKLLKEGLAKPYIVDKNNKHYKQYWYVWYHTEHIAGFGKELANCY